MAELKKKIKAKQSKAASLFKLAASCALRAAIRTQQGASSPVSAETHREFFVYEQTNAFIGK